LTFTLNAPEADGVALTVMAPARHAQHTLAELKVDGQRLPTQIRTVGGRAYAWAIVPARRHSIEVLYA
jgi:hypothetical protein